MRCLVALVVLSIGAASCAGLALAEQGRPAAKPPAPPAEPQKFTLDDLFARLSAAKSEAEAEGVAALIQRRWARSGSDTADLLMGRANEAIAAKNPALAIELLDRVIALEPGWAEAWNRRATAFYLSDDPTSAMADIRQVLVREPRHFGAWAGLGHIYMAGGDEKRALEAYRRALALHPHLSTLETIVERLSPGVEGRDI